MDPAFNYLLSEKGLWGEVTDPKLWPQSQIKTNESILTKLAETNRKQRADLIDNTESNRTENLSSLFELSRRCILENSVNTEYTIHSKLFRNWIRSDRLGKTYEITDESF